MNSGKKVFKTAAIVGSDIGKNKRLSCKIAWPKKVIAYATRTNIIVINNCLLFKTVLAGISCYYSLKWNSKSYATQKS